MLTRPLPTTQYPTCTSPKLQSDLLEIKQLVCPPHKQQKKKRCVAEPSVYERSAFPIGYLLHEADNMGQSIGLIHNPHVW